MRREPQSGTTATTSSIVAMVVLWSFMRRETIRRLSICSASRLRTRCETRTMAHVREWGSGRERCNGSDRASLGRAIRIGRLDNANGHTLWS